MTGLAERLAPPASVPYPGVHLGLRWRSIIASDAPRVYELIRTVEAADDSHHRTSTDEVANMVEGKRGIEWVDALVGIDSEHRICAVATVKVLRSLTEQANAVVNAYIHPHWRGRGLGRALLYWQDGRARQMLVETFGADSEIPVSIHNFVDAHMTDRRRLYIAAGFYAKRTFQIMYRELEGSEKAPSPRGGYTVIPWAQVPLEAVREVHMDAFLDHYRSSLRGMWWEEAIGNLDPRWSFVALSPEGEPVGYCMTGRPVERWVSTGRTEAYVELLGVAAEHRGHGLSTALLGASVAAASASGISRIGLDVDTASPSNAHSIYEHLGFVDGPAEVFYTIDQ